MNAPNAVDKREEAESVARALVEARSGVQAILLFGSVARGDAGADSDIDLMVVADGPLRDRVGGGDVSLVCHTWESFRRARDDDWSFFVHLREEGEILHESEPALRRELGAVRNPPAAARRDSLRDELRCLERYDDLARFGAGYLFPLARIFRVARHTCMLDNTARGHMAFKREDAFDAFAERRTDVGGDVSVVRELWPFQARTQGRRAEFPFSFEDPRRVTEAVQAAKRIVQAALEDPG